MKDCIWEHTTAVIACYNLILLVVLFCWSCSVLLRCCLFLDSLYRYEVPLRRDETMSSAHGTTPQIRGALGDRPYFNLNMLQYDFSLFFMITQFTHFLFSSSTCLHVSFFNICIYYLKMHPYWFIGHFNIQVFHYSLHVCFAWDLNKEIIISNCFCVFQTWGIHSEVLLEARHCSNPGMCLLHVR